MAARYLQILPGLIVCILIAAAGYACQQLELIVAGRSWFEALVLAILIGAAVRTVWTPGPRWKPGINFSAKLLLEIAVLLLGASVSAATILSAGWILLVSILGIVAGAILLSFSIGRILGLSKRMAILVACGNSICGNSAIAAVAPVIGADGDDVASSIAFTAVLGVVVVLILPLIGAALGMSELAYGALAGLTVYAVPQVIAATAPIGVKAVQIGTLVKLIRVLMLGPVCLVLSLMTARLREETDEPAPNVTAGDRPRAGRPALHQLVPWFIIGFLVMVALRSANLIPEAALGPIGDAATIFTVISMAALGLGVDFRTVSKAGGPVTLTVVLSLLALGSVSFVLVRSLGL
ncbi:MAG TPA: putative sulfate exporter family transporter [Sphingomicrobium sp.]|nr:putative sulfate exporter family transporter [Sphingomicrobium sp.]